MNKKNRFFISKKILIVAAHLGIWAMVFLVPILFRGDPPPPMQPMIRKHPPLSALFIFNILLILVFYFNYYVLIVRVLYKKGILWYLLGIVLVFGFFRLVLLITREVLENVPGTPIMFYFFPFVFLIAVGVAIRVTTDRLRDEQEWKERENETLKSELSFLRSQVSPHFLFNIMNNVVAMSRVKPHLVEPTLIQLSQLMRYMLYESDETKVTLEKESEYLTSFIELQKMRFGDGVEVIYENDLERNPISNEHNYLIEPMLLIPFVENAFKHGIGMIQYPIIHIRLKIIDNQLIFNVINKIGLDSVNEKDTDSGIGLKNVSRRLELLYGAQHSLSVNTEGAKFIVILKINLER